MRKSSVNDNNGDKTVCYDLPCSGYVTLDDNMAIPNYLVYLLNENDFIMEIDVEEELNEQVNGGDLDGDGDNAI